MKKKNLELTRFTEELSEFTHKAMLEPSYCSLYTSLGVSLLESLIRLKEISFTTETAWKNVFQKLESVKASAESFQLGDILAEFMKFLVELKKSEKTVARKMIHKAFDPNGRVNLEISMKLLIYACLNRDFEAVMAGSMPEDQIYADFSQKIGIHIIHFVDDYYKAYKCKHIGPLIFVCSNKGQYGVVYHYVSLKVDGSENLLVDYKNFPFLHNPGTKLTLRMPVSTDNVVNKFLDLCNLLTYNLKPLDAGTQTELRKMVNSLKIMCPENEARLQELYHRSISQCGHRSKEFTPACLQSHCKKCLINNLLQANSEKVFCPCGVPLDSNDVNHLSSELITPRKKEAKVISSSQSPHKNFDKKDPLTKRNSEFSTTIKKLPTIHGKTVCGICRRELRKEFFRGVQCNGHAVCVDCRAKRITAGSNHCPLCGRKYNDEENIKLRMRNNSLDLTTSLFKATNFIDSL